MVLPVKEASSTTADAGRKVLLTKGPISVLDQAFVAGASFVLSLLLARYLQRESYGAFAVVTSVYVLLVSLHTAFVGEPLVILGNGVYADHFRQYIRRVIRGHVITSLVVAVVLVGGAVLLSGLVSPQIVWALMALAVAQIVLLLFRLLRRVAYARMRVSIAAAGSLVYFVVTLAGVIVLRHLGVLSPHSAYLLIGVAAAAGCGLLAVLLGRLPGRASGQPVRGVLRGHLEYGRWAGPTYLLTWVSGQLYYLALPIWLGLASAGALRALFVLVLPIQHIFLAISMVLLPVFTRAWQCGGVKRLTRLIRDFMVLTLIGAVAYAALLFVLRDRILVWLYADRYAHLSGLVPLIALTPIGVGFCGVLETAMRAVQRMDMAFWCNLTKGILVLALVLPVGVCFGMRYLLVGMVAVPLVAGAIACVLFKRFASQESRDCEGGS